MVRADCWPPRLVTTAGKFVCLGDAAPVPPPVQIGNPAELREFPIQECRVSADGERLLVVTTANSSLFLPASGGTTPLKTGFSPMAVERLLEPAPPLSARNLYRVVGAVAGSLLAAGARVAARASTGSARPKVLPRPTSDSTQIWPPWPSTIRRQM